jgi:heterodisulfide reductase subunit A
MYSLKLAHLAHDLLDTEVVEFYRDMRTFGKEYESFYHRIEREGVEMVRYGEEIAITQANGCLAVQTTNLFTGEPAETMADMVVLSTGLEPQADQPDVARIFGLSLSPDGFFLEKHPKLAPVETATDGIFLAGACQSPKDIPDSVAQGGAAAAGALALMDAGSVTLQPYTATIDAEKCSGCFTCLGQCPYGAIEIATVNGRAVSQVNEVLCKGCGACVAACPSGIATQHGFTSEQVIAEINGALLGSLQLVEEIAL